MFGLKEFDEFLEEFEDQPTKEQKELEDFLNSGISNKQELFDLLNKLEEETESLIKNHNNSLN